MPFERRYYKSPNSTISIVARVKGFISKAELRNAIQKVRYQHPLVGVRIFLDENGDPWYTTENVPEKPLSVVKRTSEKIWNKD